MEIRECEGCDKEITIDTMLHYYYNPDFIMELCEECYDKKMIDEKCNLREG